MSITNVSVQIPAGGLDRRYVVRFTDSELPWPVALFYVRVQHSDDETGQVDSSDWFNVGFEVGDRYDLQSSDQPALFLSRMPTRRLAKPNLIHKVVDRYEDLDEQARRILEGSQLLDVAESVVPVKRERTRRVMSPESLRGIAEKVERYKRLNRSPAKELARDEGVNLSTAYRWIAQANEQIENDRRKK